MGLALKQQEDRQAGREITQREWFAAIDERTMKSLQNVKVMKLKGLSKVEARGLMEYWAASGVLRARVDEKSVAEKWALAGNGIVGEIERGSLRARI
jgi:small subunit ribosomal protein S29